MNAFLVLLTVVLGPGGSPMLVTIKLPWSSVAHCEKYIADPTPIYADWGRIQLLGSSASCEPRGEKPA